MIKDNYSKDVSIIIINYKTASLVFDCIKSIIKNSNGFTYEIIVVDNSNSDEEYKLLLSKENELTYRIINTKTNLGTVKANNLAAFNSNGKALLFLNSDTLLINNAIKEMLDSLFEKDDVGIVGANLYSDISSPTQSYEKEALTINSIKKDYSLSSKISRLTKREKDFNYSGSCINIYGCVIGAALMVKKEPFLKVGGFDSRIFMYQEEFFLTRVFYSSLHLRTINNPNAKIIHLEGKSDKPCFSDFKVKNIVFGYILYFYNFYGKKESILFTKAFIKIFRRQKFESFILGKKKTYNNSGTFLNVSRYFLRILNDDKFDLAKDYSFYIKK